MKKILILNSMVLYLGSRTKFYTGSCLVFLQVPKFFVLVQIFWASSKIYLHIVPVTNILCQTKRWFAFSKIGFLCQYKSFWRGTKCSQIFRLAQKIWTSTKRFGTCKRTRHKSLLPYYIYCACYLIELSANTFDSVNWIFFSSNSKNVHFLQFFGHFLC